MAVSGDKLHSLLCLVHSRLASLLFPMLTPISDMLLMPMAISILSPFLYSPALHRPRRHYVKKDSVYRSIQQWSSPISQKSMLTLLLALNAMD